MTERSLRLAALVAALAVATTSTTFLDWGRSGRRRRSSYEVVDVADRAGVLADGWAWAAPLLYLAPAVCGVAVLAVAVRRPSIAGVATTTLGALVVTAATLVVRSPLATEPAAWAAVALGAASVVGGVAVVVTARKEQAG